MTKKLTRAAFFTALALIAGLIESMLPPLLPFAPGARMGLANAVILVALVLLGTTDAYLIQSVRLLLSAVFAGSLSSLIYSVPAGMCSLTVMAVLYRFLVPKCGLLTVSFIGAFTHNLVQLFVAGLVAGVSFMPLVPLMMVASVIAGAAVGIISAFTVKYLPKSLYLQ